MPKPLKKKPAAKKSTTPKRPASDPNRRARHLAYVPQSYEPVFEFTVEQSVLLGRMPYRASYGGFENAVVGDQARRHAFTVRFPKTGRTGHVAEQERDRSSGPGLHLRRVSGSQAGRRDVGIYAVGKNRWTYRHPADLVSAPIAGVSRRLSTSPARGRRTSRASSRVTPRPLGVAHRARP